MDYRINVLKEDIICDKIGVPEYPTIMFGVCGVYNVFNLTEYLKSINNSYDDYRTISRRLIGLIDKLSASYNIPVTELFFKNPNGDELVNGILIYLFLIVLDEHFLRYMNDLIDDVLVEGVAYSDNFIALQAHRLPPDILNKIANEQKDISKQENNSDI